jgi:hypothetical protein
VVVTTMVHVETKATIVAVFVAADVVGSAPKNLCDTLRTRMVFLYRVTMSASGNVRVDGRPWEIVSCWMPLNFVIVDQNRPERP